MLSKCMKKNIINLLIHVLGLYAKYMYEKKYYQFSNACTCSICEVYAWIEYEISILIWSYLNSEDNTWEPEENLDCPDLISEYENKAKAAKAKRKTETDLNTSKRKKPESTPSVSSSTTQVVSNENSAPAEDKNPNRGFDRGLQPEKIIGATDSSGELMFLMKWKNSDEADLVLAKTANVRCPQVVIQFYEERLTWHTGAEDKEDKTAEAASVDVSAK